MAKIAKHLLYAHLCILFVAIVGGAMTLISGLVARSAISDFWARSGEVVVTDPKTEMAGYAGNICGGLVLPVLLLIFVCCAIKNNDKCLLRCLCVTDGIGVFCQCCGGVLTISLLGALAKMKGQIEKLDCNYVDDASTNWTKQDCMDARETLLPLIGMAHTVYIISTVLSFLLMAVCFWAQRQAHEGHQALTQGEVFVGTPVGIKPPESVVVGAVVRQPEGQKTAV
eukprot:CAMPEP_0194759214 /NCGR_PEP_ID=MMETSP0323_2-20130528/12293_1 /TAXON_ID=2866 ORGANISM="Crypthecodinium cohnii, Strain Seligo" /NCGR_SAMPLE_ID=MMETSP0323_2 /ASSEMBLY_ACC=CAM_ASM_000346 /LENGTH=225 /DNA_ID=CAMNT_0039679825 /DNA_START=207 /DNA_END=884 /DNA_ORIENTATION=+